MMRRAGRPRRRARGEGVGRDFHLTPLLAKQGLEQ